MASTFTFNTSSSVCSLISNAHICHRAGLWLLSLKERIRRLLPRWVSGYLTVGSNQFLWWKIPRSFQQRNVWISEQKSIWITDFLGCEVALYTCCESQRYCNSSSSYLSGKQKVGDDTGLEKVNQYKSTCPNTNAAEDMKRHAERAGLGPPVHCRPRWWTAPVDASLKQAKQSRWCLRALPFVYVCCWQRKSSELKICTSALFSLKGCQVGDG